LLPRLEEPEKIDFELDDAKSESSEEDEAEEEEPHTPVLRREVRERKQPEKYSPPDFCSNFVLPIIDNDLGIVREAMNSENSKL
jgi:hypothetical protein